MPPTPSTVRLLFQDDAIVLGLWSNVVINDLRGSLRREHIAEIARACRTAEKLHPRGLLSLAILRDGVPVADAAVRSESTKLLETFSGVIRQVAIVLEGSGIWASTMRTIVRGVAVVAKTPFGLTVYSDLSSAAPSLVTRVAELTSERPTVDELLGAVRALREAAGEPSMPARSFGR